MNSYALFLGCLRETVYLKNLEVRNQGRLQRNGSGVSYTAKSPVPGRSGARDGRSKQLNYVSEVAASSGGR
jgi:hypothetical protein